jgi:acyl-CoA thioesterase-1
LEALLRSAGYDVAVANEGTSGQTTAEELGRLNGAVPLGTRIVIFQPGGNDQRVGGIDTEGNVRQIVKRLLARNVLVLLSAPPATRQYVRDLAISTIGEINRLAPNNKQYDGDHLTKEGYGIVAQRMFPFVKALLQKLSEEDAKVPNPASSAASK